MTLLPSHSASETSLNMIRIIVWPNPIVTSHCVGCELIAARAQADCVRAVARVLEPLFALIFPGSYRNLRVVPAVAYPSASGAASKNL